MPVNVKDILTENSFLNNQNANYRGYIQDIADYVLPRKAWITSIRAKGERIKFNFLYDSTAIRSLRIMASGFHTHLTNPSSRWFALEANDKDLMRDMDVRMWFKEVEDIIFNVLNGSNFYNTIQEFYTDFGSFGTGTFLMLEDDKDKVRFTEIPPGQINLVEDANGRLVGCYRNFKLTAYQAYKMWGDNSGESVLDCKEKKPFEEFEFIHHVGERHERDASLEGQDNMPFHSVWISVKDKHIVSKGGFHENPYISGRFYKDPNDVNGFSPTMDVFAEIKLVNAMKRTVIRAGMKHADPPMIAPSRGFVLPLNLNPAAMNYRDAKTPSDALRALDVGRGNLPITLDMIKSVQHSIEEGMFVGLFRSLSEITKQMTIPEVQRRVAENMTLLGPVVGRTIHEVLDPSIIRLFNILMRNMELPEPPESLQGQEFSPVYLSPLARSQRSSEITEIQSFLADVQAIASLKPSALDKINEDSTVDVLSRVRGITPEIMNDESDVERMRVQRQQQEALAASLQVGGEIAGIAKTGAEAERSGIQ